MRFATIAAMAGALCSCGYHVAGKADLLPKTVHTIAIPSWQNLSARYQLPDRLTGAIAREFVSRTRYRIVADPNDADAILNGAVISYQAYPTIYDSQTNRAAAVQATVVLQVRLTERASGRVLFDRPNYAARTSYEVSVNGAAFFDESGAAMDRLSREVARNLVSSILEQF